VQQSDFVKDAFDELSRSPELASGEINNAPRQRRHTLSGLEILPPCFPVTSPKRQSPPSPSSTLTQLLNPSEWAAPPRILLVEDDEICQHLSRKLLQKIGCQIDVVADGRAAISQMNFAKYDLVLMVCRFAFCGLVITLRIS
jgi:hypothetical protein